MRSSRLSTYNGSSPTVRGMSVFFIEDNIKKTHTVMFQIKNVIF